MAKHSPKRGRARFAPFAPIALVMLFAAPSAAGGPSPEEWANEVCSGVATWTTEIENQASFLSGALGSSVDLDTARDALVALQAAGVDSTTRLLQVLKQAGAPDVKNGKAIATAFKSAFKKIRDASRKAERQFSELPIDDTEAFTEGVDEARRVVVTATDAAYKTLTRAGEKADSPGFARAVEAEPACAPLRPALEGSEAP